MVIFKFSNFLKATIEVTHTEQPAGNLRDTRPNKCCYCSTVLACIRCVAKANWVTCRRMLRAGDEAKLAPM